MNGYIITLLSLTIAGMFGFLWFALGRMGSRQDALDAKFTTFDERLREIEQTMARWDERFAHVEDQLHRVLQHVEAIEKRVS